LQSCWVPHRSLRLGFGPALGAGLLISSPVLQQSGFQPTVEPTAFQAVVVQSLRLRDGKWGRDLRLFSGPTAVGLSADCRTHRLPGGRGPVSPPVAQQPPPSRPPPPLPT